MVAHVGTAFDSTNPHVRQIDPWRDGRAVANLLESAFRDEIVDDNGQYLIHSLRHYGALEALTFGLGTGFVWVEDGAVLGNASVQRSLTRKDVWIVGNVATQTEFRNRGIGRALVEACVNYSAARGAHVVALQVDAANQPALHLYDKLGFERLGEVTHYLRAQRRAHAPRPAHVLDAKSRAVRKARWSDREEVLSLMRSVVPEQFTFAEPIDMSVYRLGLRWSLVNALSGNVSQWLVCNAVSPDGRPARLAGAVRTRVSLDGSKHQLELLLSSDATADVAASLLARALDRFEDYLSKPIVAAQPHPQHMAHAALRDAGFQPIRTLAHMRLRVH
jgi:ribosomal protein S18 acetylase RimI-like enzyme